MLVGGRVLLLEVSERDSLPKPMRSSRRLRCTRPGCGCGPGAKGRLVLFFGPSGPLQEENKTLEECLQADGVRVAASGTPTSGQAEVDAKKDEAEEVKATSRVLLSLLVEMQGMRNGMTRKGNP